MYAGFLTARHSTRWLGSHQKLNRLAYHSLTEEGLLEGKFFPLLRSIQHFEGINGPDGIKVKSPAQNEPHHFYDPMDPDDTELIDMLNQHMTDFKAAHQEKNLERLAFEASWLAHAITDGLTPAHQFPFHQELEEIRGEPAETRDSKRKKVFASGDTKRQTVAKNWKLWGNKGLLLTHYNFEIGVATVLIPMRLKSIKLEPEDIKQAREMGIIEYFKEQALLIYQMHMYDRFYKQGWSTVLAKDAKALLIPRIAKTIAVAWYLGLTEGE